MEESIQEQFDRFANSMRRNIEIIDVPQRYKKLLADNAVEIMKNAVTYFADKEIGNQIK